MFDQICSNVLLPCGRQGAVRESLHPDTLKVSEHAHASRRGRAGATTLLLEIPHHHSRCRAHRTRARHCRQRQRNDDDDTTTTTTLLSFSLSSLYSLYLTHFRARDDVFSILSYRARTGNNVASQPASVVIRLLSSCRHLLRRSRSDPRRPLYDPPLRSAC